MRIERILAALIALQSAAAQNNLERPWTPSSAYAGSRVCAGCHREISTKQESSNHARSLRPPAEIEELKKELPYQYADRISGTTLRLEAAGANKLELTARRGDRGERLILQWAFGSGVKGITPVGKRPDGSFVESRLSWYATQHGLGLTTGAGTRDPATVAESLGRSLTNKEVRECFSCHTTAYAPGQPEPARSEMGIRCERCHGPGLEHVRLMQAGVTYVADRKIFHPGRLDAFAQAEMCGTCHGRPPRDTDLVAIRFIERDPNTARFPSQRLVLSRCFNEADEGLRCTRCHDPHTNVVAQREQRDRSCLGCHGPGAKARTCPAAAAGCPSCHMTKEKVMLHSEFTDHWIRVARHGAPGSERR